MRKENISFIDFNEDDPMPVYCPYCEKVGNKNKLQARIYEPDHPNPVDADSWLQCYRCGRIIPLYEVKEELDYGPVVDIVDNPFDSGSEFKSVEKRSKKKRTPRNKKHNVDLDMAGETGEINIVYDSQGNY